jgi:hypothetical protein
MFGHRIVEFLHKRIRQIFSLLAFGERWFLSLSNECVSKWLMLNAKRAIFQLYHGENKLHLDEMMSTF